MTLTQIERRVKVLEQTVGELTKFKPAPGNRWYRTHAGRFANDPVFDEIVKLGRTYRRSQSAARPAKRP